MNDNQESLRKRIQKSPTSPGIYRWLNAKGEVLYIGKAKNLKNRLKSYVQENPDKSLGPWKLSLIKHIVDFDVTTTTTELEALMLETNLIKEAKPKYNVLMKDDKNYVYVCISDDEYPAITVERQMADDNATYFGPFITAYNIKRTLDMLHELFGFRACSSSIQRKNKEAKARAFSAADQKGCMEFQIKQCNGLCVDEINKEQYNERIGEVKKFLKGNHKDAAYRLKEMMDRAASQKKFEKAGKLRDTLMYIESLGTKQVVSDTSRENTDAIGIALQNGKAHVVILRERGGKLREERSFALSGEADKVGAAISELIPQYYSIESDIPDLILVQEEITDKDVLEAWLQLTTERRIEIRFPERGKKSKLLAMAQSNAKQKVEQQFARWEAASKNISDALEQLKDVLELPSIPKRIEGYDISHLGGTETVGSMVVMKNGKSANKEYRSFTLRTIKEGEIDDYKALKEVLRRRLRYLSNEEEKWKEKGVTFGKTKKAEQVVLEEIIARHPEELGQNTLSYKDIAVARFEGNIIASGRLTTHKDNTLELQSIWVDDQFRGQKLGQFMARYILKKIPKGKVYILIKENLEEYYTRLGFRHVHTPPKVLAEALQSKDHPKDCQTVMVYNTTDNKIDISLNATPDLLVIDGGKGQLSAVVEVLKEMEMEIPVIGLAKREEEIFIPGESFPVDIPKDSQASFLLQRLRDEAHRFANAHREKRLTKKMFQ